MLIHSNNQTLLLNINFLKDEAKASFPEILYFDIYRGEDTPTYGATTDISHIAYIKNVITLQ
jgi:hypothetical protein